MFISCMVTVQKNKIALLLEFDFDNAKILLKLEV